MLPSPLPPLRAISQVALMVVLVICESDDAVMDRLAWFLKLLFYSRFVM